MLSAVETLQERLLEKRSSHLVEASIHVQHSSFHTPFAFVVIALLLACKGGDTKFSMTLAQRQLIVCSTAECCGCSVSTHNLTRESIPTTLGYAARTRKGGEERRQHALCNSSSRRPC